MQRTESATWNKQENKIDMNDIQIKKDIVKLIGQHPINAMNEVFEWLKKHRGVYDYHLRLRCIKQSFPNHEETYNWITQDSHQESLENP